jgi:hypothetical protein
MLRSAVLLGLGIACLGVDPSAQVQVTRTERARGNLGNDIRERSVPQTSHRATELARVPRLRRGPGNLSGDIVVDMSGDVRVTGPELTFETHRVGDGLVPPPERPERAKLRLADGTPGAAGVILIDTGLPEVPLEGDIVVVGSFGVDGVLEIELPAELVLGGSFSAQGAELSPDGPLASRVLQVRRARDPGHGHDPLAPRRRHPGTIGLAEPPTVLVEQEVELGGETIVICEPGRVQRIDRR